MEQLYYEVKPAAMVGLAIFGYSIVPHSKLMLVSAGLLMLCGILIINERSRNRRLK